ncbi:MAG: shikimate kinase [Rhodococcus sp.]|nr:shikimate kinase [Rhodococcus sp. (in: high G+C Gram-positive bacteria)]
MAPIAVLIGPPGAGKSTIGRRLATALDVPLLDTDIAIEETAGRSIPEIFATDGEPVFRELEEQVVAKSLREHDGVLSLGGGAVLSTATRKLLEGHTVVYLEISVAEGLKRTGAATGRPLLTGGDPRAKYREMMRLRRPIYRQVATLRVRTDGRSPARVVQQLVTELEKSPHAGHQSTGEQ